tara:strand:+ start:856 stop:1041 length:186 start_codon:yes stop_codon:yes gene_type:complete
MVDNKTEKAIAQIHAALLLAFRYVDTSATHDGLTNTETMMEGLRGWDHIVDMVKSINEVKS